MLLHLRDGEITRVGCDDGVLAIGTRVDGLEGPDSVDVGDEGCLETLGPHSSRGVAADVLAGEEERHGGKCGGNRFGWKCGRGSGR